MIAKQHGQVKDAKPAEVVGDAQFAWYQGLQLMLFDVTNGFSGTEILKVTYSVPTGQSLSTFSMITLTAAQTTWSMTNSASLSFTGTGFTPSVNYALKKNGVLIQCLPSSGTGALTASIPASPLATYDLIRGGC